MWRGLAAAGRVAVELQVGAGEDVADENGDCRGLRPCGRRGVHLGVC